MLVLNGIKKDYPAGSGVVHALRGIDLQFRKSEFVAILGPSGCGKTTLLNIIGGLDGYTEGDLVINGVSTKKYKDRDWDAYRNHSVGFVFQSYNLIPHQTVLQNVELALTLSGVSKSERRQRAKAALEEVGLGDQLNKRPGEMSGGQMQRVAIARALVNNPDIILADEPTGALDTETSLQVMEILKRISKDRLIVMVTHNPDLANTYASRIINMLDGRMVNDSDPLSPEELAAEEACMQMAETNEKKAKKAKQPSMSFGTSFMLSLKNLFTKKGRTTLTAFAGSIGIIGIALILSVSQGMTAYIDYVQETTLSAYPLTLQETAVDMTALMQSMMNTGKGQDRENKDAVYKDPIIGELVNALSKVETSENDLSAFKAFLESEMAKEDSQLGQAMSGIQYTYNLNLAIYTENIDGQIIKSDMAELMTEMIGDFFMKLNQEINGSTGSGSGSMTGSSSMSSSPMMSSMMGLNMWQELLPGLDNGQPVNDLLKEQYDVIYGSWPNDKDEIVLVLNENNELDDLTLYALGLLSKEEIDAIIDAAATGNELPQDPDQKWSYEHICGLTFKAILPYNCYKPYNGIYVDVSKNESMLKMLYESDDALELKVVGIIRPNEDAETAMLTGSIGYTHMLTEYVIKDAKNSDVVQAQLASPTVDVLTGLPFQSNTGNLTDEQKTESFRAYVAELTTAQKAQVYIDIQCLKVEAAQLASMVDMIMGTMTDKDALIQMISQAMAEQMGVGAQEIAAYLDSMTLEELKEMMRPSIEEQMKASIRAEVELGFSEILEDQIAALLMAELDTYSQDDCALYYDEITEFSGMSYEQVMTAIGHLDLDSPASINLYASSFENKDIITDTIADYNDRVEEAQKIAYTDYLGIMMSSITTIINAITYVLIAFVAISLVVSSIMIGVITLISVQERTKEIGILRAIGASKRNVSSMFNAETMIIGFAAGLLGVVVTYLLCIPINLILYSLTGLANLKAFLPIPAALILMAISVGLTLISGLIPSRSAAKKDPVVALRTE